MPQGRFE